MRLPLSTGDRSSGRTEAEHRRRRRQPNAKRRRLRLPEAWQVLGGDRSSGRTTPSIQYLSKDTRFRRKTNGPPGTSCWIQDGFLLEVWGLFFWERVAASTFAHVCQVRLGVFPHRLRAHWTSSDTQLRSLQEAKLVVAQFVSCKGCLGRDVQRPTTSPKRQLAFLCVCVRKFFFCVPSTPVRDSSLHCPSACRLQIKDSN